MADIILDKINFQYPRSTFSVKVDRLELESNKVTIFCGSNGSGKTTILKLCSGILRPDEGEVFLFGEKSTDYSLGKIGTMIGYLFQEPSKQLFTATVWDELTFAPYIRGVNKDEIRDKAEKILKKIGLFHIRKRSTYNLSRGEKQRLAIAAILMQDIKYLILDEPTTGLDKENRLTLYTLLEELLFEGKGISIISHDKELIERFSYGEKVWVKEGRIIYE